MKKVECEFDKGCWFAVATNDTAKEKVVGKAKQAKIDPADRLTNKIQRKLYKVTKENKFTNKTYFELDPSNQPRLNGTIKVHKPEENFPMRVTVSIIGTPLYVISKCRVDIIQPTLSKKQPKV